MVNVWVCSAKPLRRATTVWAPVFTAVSPFASTVAPSRVSVRSPGTERAANVAVSSPERDSIPITSASTSTTAPATAGRSQRLCLMSSKFMTSSPLHPDRDVAGVVVPVLGLRDVTVPGRGSGVVPTLVRTGEQVGVPVRQHDVARLELRGGLGVLDDLVLVGVGPHVRDLAAGTALLVVRV